MARIQAGSTLVNQYAPPFVVSDSVTQGWELIWSDTLQAFEAVDPSANTVNAGFDEINVQLYENVTQQTFVAPFATDSKQSVIITIDGVKQQQDAYSWSSDTASNTTTITLADTVSSETVEILGLQTVGGATVELYGPQPIDSNMLGTVNAYYDLNWFAPSAESLIVTVDGVKQATNNYNITPVPGSNFTNTRLTFPDRTITFNTTSGVDDTNHIITTDTVHGFEDGDGVYYGDDGNPVPTLGLTNGTLYYVAVLSAFTLAIHTLRDNALNDAGNGDPNRVSLTSVGAETHALTLITDPYLYINDDTDNLANIGSGYSVSDVLTVQGGSPVIEAQIRVDEIDVDADIIFSTDVSGNIAAGALTINDGGSGYPLNQTGQIFTISNASLPGNGDAVVTYDTNGLGQIVAAVVTTPGTGYTASQTDVSIDASDLPLQNGANSGTITAYSFLHLGEYVVSPGPTANLAGGTGSGAQINVSTVSPQLEVIGITTTGETPASPVNATNLGNPDDAAIFGLYDSKSVSGETQVLNFRSIQAGTNITITPANDTVSIAADNPVFAQTATGGGTSLFDQNTIDQDAPTFRKLLAGDRIAFSVAAADNPISIAYNFAYSAPTSAATLTYGTEIPSTARLVDVTPFAGGTTLNLPAGSSVTQGDTITIKDGAGTALANNIIVTPNGTDQIDGVNAAVTLNTNRAYITLFSDGTHWHIIGQG